MDIYAHLPRLLHFIGNPYFPVIVMAAGLFILWCQGWKSQLQPPKSVLIHGITKEPFQLKYRMWPSLRHALWACVWALVIVVPAVVVYKSPIRNFIFVEPLPVYAKVPPPPPTLIKVGGPTPVPSAATSGHYKKQITQSLPSVPVQNNMLPQKQPASAPPTTTNEASRNEPPAEGDRERLAEAFYEWSQILEGGNTAWGKANHLKVDEKGPFLQDLAKRKGKIPDIKMAAQQFAKHLIDSRNKWRYYEKEENQVFGDNVDNDANILPGALSEYDNQLDTVLASKETDNERLKTIMWPEDLRYDEAIKNFAQWLQGCGRRLQTAREAIR